MELQTREENQELHSTKELDELPEFLPEDDL